MSEMVATATESSIVDRTSRTGRPQCSPHDAAGGLVFRDDLPEEGAMYDERSVNMIGVEKNGDHHIYLFVDEQRRATMMRICRHAIDPRRSLDVYDAEFLCDQIEQMTV